MIKSKSNKQISEEAKLKKVYAKIDSEREPVCTGCGIGKNLSHSHLISRKHKEFMSDERNIKFHCQSANGKKGCAEKWENTGERLQLRDYIENMEYIKEVAPEIFRSMIVKDKDYYVNNTDIGDLCPSDNLDYLIENYKIL